MNEQEIETLLLKAPRMRAPAGLRARLEEDIALPHTAAASPAGRRASTFVSHHQSTVRATRPSGGWLRRWMPALGFALWILGCVVVLGVQGRMIRQLKAEEARRAAEAIAAAMIPVQPMSSDSAAAELDRLRKDAAAVQRLRDETAQLRKWLAEVPALRAANEKLREELKNQVAPTPPPEDDLFGFMEREKEKAQRLQCVNHLKQVLLAARVWANDHPQTDGKKFMPASFEAMGNELHTEKITFCPGAGARYELLSPGATTEDPHVVFVRCAHHNNVGMMDGSVTQLGPSTRPVQRNGKWILERVDSGGAP